MFRLYGSVYKTLCTYAKNKKSFTTDLINKDVIINKNQFVKDGEGVKYRFYIEPEDLKEFGIEDCFNDPWGEVIPKLYELYKHSYVDKKKYQKKSKFVAIDKADLTDEDIMNGLDRNYATALLEGYILLASIQGVLKWENDKHWFWQGDDKDLIIKREWLVE